MAKVVTYQWANIPGEVTLCTMHDNATDGLGPVSHGEHEGICDACHQDAPDDATCKGEGGTYEGERFTRCKGCPDCAHLPAHVYSPFASCQCNLCCDEDARERELRGF